MLAALGVVTVVALLVLIVGRLASPLVALIAVPVLASLAGGFGLSTAKFIVAGIQQIAPVAAMFVFAILYFGIITDAGTLEPIINAILRAVGMRPARVVVGSALLALLVHLDGSGAVTFLVAVPAMLPLYDRLRIDRRILACVVSMAAGVNFLPWTGPMIRASASLHVPVARLFRPLVGVQLVGLAFVFAAAWWLGRRAEGSNQGQTRVRLGSDLLRKSFATEISPSPAENYEKANIQRRRSDPSLTLVEAGSDPSLTPVEGGSEPRIGRPGLVWVNGAITVAIMALMIAGTIEPAVVFMIGTAIVLTINYPKPAQQRERIDAHAKAALMMAAILLAAGAFTGIMKESGMLAAMAQAAVGAIPPRLAPHIPLALAIVSMPLSLLFDPDSFYLGVLPVVAQVAGQFGVPAVAVGQAALLGQMTTGFPVSPLTPATFLVVGLTGIELGEHQRFTGPFLFAATLIMTAAAVAFGVFPP
jgi:citrate-Mg2+:H+ or citrate-Ca2+:H+ symporter, CitMHS family